LSWTHDEIEKLRELWTRGDTAREIANELGCSRNAVLGMKWRLGLEPRESGGAAAARAVRALKTPDDLTAIAQRREAREQRRTQKQQRADNSQRQRLQAAQTRKPARIRVVAREGRLVEPLNLPFGDLDDNQKPTMCRFITGEREGQKLFCARPTEHDTSYCDDCARVVFTADGYERVIQNEVKPLRQPANGRVAKPFRMPYELAGVALDVREVPFS
jgi:hypothetical protein